MIRSLTLLLLGLPIWAQFEAAPPQQSYPEPYPQQQAPAGYPPYQTQEPQYPVQQQYPPQQPYPNQPQQPYPGQQPQYSAQQDDQGRDFATDQQHGVARLRVVQGDVNVKRGDNGTLTAAIMNAPLLTGDHLQTSGGSRAEVELDASNVIRLAPGTDLGFANLAFGWAQVQLGLGTIIVRVLRDSQAQIEVDTPSVALHPLMPGEYRISVFDNGTSQITVHAGRLEMTGPRGSQTVEQGQSLMLRGDPSDPEFQQTAAPGRDQFDDWSESRDGEMLSARSPQYVSGDIYGAEDLDQYGNWVPSQYGQVWAPQNLPQDWSPYSNGQWTYADYYGWTWIGYEPWGWAPYHYGRWFFNGGVGWCWWPGAHLGFGFHWSPALVSFFGFGGGLGWVSLAPFEVFHPWWGHGFGGWAAYRGGYDLNRFYRNAGVRGGAITAGYNSFAGAGHRFSIASGAQLRAASLYRGAPVGPSAAGYRFTNRSVSANPRFTQAASRSFFSSGGVRTAGSSFGSGGRVGGGYAASGGSGGGWQRFGSPAPQRSTQGTNGGGYDGGWHSFGQPQAPRYSAPAQSNYGASGYRGPSSNSAPHYNYSAPSAPRYNSAPRYSAPSSPRYSAAPHYSAPAAPHYSAPRGSGGGGGGHVGGGGGGHASGGGGHHR